MASSSASSGDDGDDVAQSSTTDFARQLLATEPGRSAGEWEAAAYRTQRALLDEGVEDPGSAHFVLVLRRAALLLNRLPVAQLAR